MNKKVIITISTAAALTITSLAFYASRNPLEVTYQPNGTGSSDFGLPRFIPVKGFTGEQVRAIEKQVCGGVGREDWAPLQVVFAYLDPKETVYRIPCGIGPAGNFYRTFYFFEAGPAIIDEYHPNAQSLFDIISPKQAAEYVMYFDIILSS